MAEKHPDIVVGVVSQQKLLNNAGQLHFTPGVYHVIHHSIMFIMPSRCASFWNNQ